MRAFGVTIFFFVLLFCVYIFIPNPIFAGVDEGCTGIKTGCKSGEVCSNPSGGVCIPKSNSSIQGAPTNYECESITGGTCMRKSICLQQNRGVNYSVKCASSLNICCINNPICYKNEPYQCPAIIPYLVTTAVDRYYVTRNVFVCDKCVLEKKYILFKGLESNYTCYGNGDPEDVIGAGIPTWPSQSDFCVRGQTGIGYCTSYEHFACSGNQSCFLGTCSGYQNVSPKCQGNLVACSTEEPIVNGGGGVAARYEISGNVFKDTNANGKKDMEDTVYSGGIVTLTGRDPGLKTSNSKGNYSFAGRRSGIYTIKLTRPPGYRNTTPISQTVSLPPNALNVNFGVAQTYTISGNVFIDTNGNNVKDFGEQNFTEGGIHIIANSGSVSVSQSTGTYTVSNLLLGTYIVSYATPPTGFQMSAPINGTPPSFSVTVGSNCTVVNNDQTGASCSGNNVVNLNFAIKRFASWMQTYGLDLRFDDGYTNIIPPSPAFPGYASIIDATPAGTPVTPSTAPVVASGTINPASTTGSTVTGLAQNTTYKVVIAGRFYFDNNSGTLIRADAQWKTPLNSTTYSIHNNGILFNGVNRTSTDYTTTANTSNHTYTFNWSSGSNTQLNLRINDSNYSDNSSIVTLTYNIYPQTYAPCGDTSSPTGNILSQGVQATASSIYLSDASTYGPANAVDGIFDRNKYWNSGGGPTKWIEFNLARPQTINGLKLYVRQDPGGRTIHQIYTGTSSNPTTLSRALDCNTEDNQTINVVFNPPLTNTQYIRINTPTSPSWVDWTEVEVYGPGALASFTTPGIVFTGNGPSNFGNGQPSTTGWLVGGTSYSEVFSQSTIPSVTSYQYLLDKAIKSGTVINDLASSTLCPDLSNCSLPANLSNGVYKAEGDVNLNGYTFPGDKNFVFLINGDLRIQGNIITPNGSSVLFTSSNDILVDKGVGAATNTYPLPIAQIQALFSADRNFIVEGISSCSVGTDKMLNLEGAIVTNAGEEETGTFKNFRDLCGSNATIPSFTIRQRIDFLLNAPIFISKQNTTFREETP